MTILLTLYQYYNIMKAIGYLLIKDMKEIISCTNNFRSKILSKNIMFIKFQKITPCIPSGRSVPTRSVLNRQTDSRPPASFLTTSLAGGEFLPPLKQGLNILLLLPHVTDIHLNCLCSPFQVISIVTIVIMQRCNCTRLISTLPCLLGPKTSSKT